MRLHSFALPCIVAMLSIALFRASAFRLGMPGKISMRLVDRGGKRLDDSEVIVRLVCEGETVRQVGAWCDSNGRVSLDLGPKVDSGGPPVAWYATPLDRSLNMSQSTSNCDDPLLLIEAASSDRLLGTHFSLQFRGFYPQDGLDLGAVPLDRLANCQVSVVDCDGLPIAGAIATAGLSSQFVSAYSDGQGIAALELPSGASLIQVVAPGYRLASRHIDVGQGAVAVTMEPASVLEITIGDESIEQVCVVGLYPIFCGDSLDGVEWLRLSLCDGAVVSNNAIGTVWRPEHGRVVVNDCKLGPLTVIGRSRGQDVATATIDVVDGKKSIVQL